MKKTRNKRREKGGAKTRGDYAYKKPSHVAMEYFPGLKLASKGRTWGENFTADSGEPVSSSSSGTVKLEKVEELEKLDGIEGIERQLHREFRPLLRKLSGVEEMTFYTKDDQHILLIGEQHTKNFCREKGFVPLGRIVEGFLEGAQSNVDFMFETDNHVSETSFQSLSENQRNYETVRRLLMSEENKPLEVKNGLLHTVTTKPFNPDDLKQTITLTNFILQKYIPKPKHQQKEFQTFDNARVHWIDPSDIYTEIDVFPNLLIKKFATLVAQYAYREESDANRFMCLDTIEEINGLLNIPVRRVPPDITTSWPDITQEERRGVFQACLDKLVKTKFFKTCFESGRAFDKEVYTDIFMEGMEEVGRTYDRDDVVVFYFGIQRFFLDMYTMCRILKKEKGWYKRIVIYVGQLHALRLKRFFEQLRYTRHEVHGVQYNHTCE